MLIILLWRFALLSLIAVGGANVVLPEIQRLVVLEGWMGAREFATLFAIAQAAPGPNVLVVALVGWRVAGVAGAFVAMLGICGPSSLLSYHASRLWRRHKRHPGVQVVKRALLPVSAGLVASGGWLLGLSGWDSAAAVLLSLLVAWGAVHGRLHPLCWLAAGAAAGALGWV